MKTEHDYIIVGAGTAGCVLAHRLSEDGRYSVLLLEHGGDDRTWILQMAPADFKRQAHDWDVWECADPTFAHHYEQGVTLFVDQGAATISFSTGDVVELQAGDLLTINVGAKGVWAITQTIRNLYRYA